MFYLSDYRMVAAIKEDIYGCVYVCVRWSLWRRMCLANRLASYYASNKDPRYGNIRHDVTPTQPRSHAHGAWLF